MQSHLNDEALRKTQSFGDFKKAYNYYCELADGMNLTNAEYSNCVEMKHEAGGRGFDYRIELIPAE